MVYSFDLKSNGPKDREGSTPSQGTMSKRYS